MAASSAAAAQIMAEGAAVPAASPKAKAKARIKRPAVIASEKLLADIDKARENLRQSMKKMTQQRRKEKRAVKKIKEKANGLSIAELLDIAMVKSAGQHAKARRDAAADAGDSGAAGSEEWVPENPAEAMTHLMGERGAASSSSSAAPDTPAGSESQQMDE